MVILPLLVTVTVSQSAPLAAHLSVKLLAQTQLGGINAVSRWVHRRAHRRTRARARLKGRWKDLIEVAITANDDLRGNVANETEIDNSREDVGKKN